MTVLSSSFTYAEFEKFCRAIAELPVLSVDHYLTNPPPVRPFVVLRFDVDFRETHAVALAEIAAQHGLSGSFYFRCHAAGFPLAAMEKVAALGHEIGYHFETLDTCQGDFRAAEDLFVAHLHQLRDAGFAIHTVAAHGSQPTATTYRANFDLFKHSPDLLARAVLHGETTISVDFSRVLYVSDALWRWRCYSSYTHGQRGKPTTLRVLLTNLPGQFTGLYVNFHPHQWFDTAWRAQYFRTRNWLGQFLLPLISPHIRTWLRRT